MPPTMTTMMMMMAPPTTAPPPQPPVQMNGIVYPHPHDVLCGRGGQSNVHPGNTQWRMLVATNKELYVTLPKKQKMMLSQSIVNAVRSQNPPGRFLQKDVHHDVWYDVGDKRAQEKTSQALREGAPEIRTKLTQGGTPPDVTVSSADTVVASNSNDNSNSNKANAVRMEEATTTGTTTTTRVMDSSTLVPPPVVPLGPSTSREQMPPPETVPAANNDTNSSSNHQQHHNDDKDSHNNTNNNNTITNNNTSNSNSNNKIETATAPSTVKRSASRSRRRSISQTTTATRIPEDHDAIPLPTPFFGQEAHAGCSFGSMGLMSDMDQARLMQSLLTTTTPGVTDGSFGSTHSAAVIAAAARTTTFMPPPAAHYPTSGHSMKFCNGGYHTAVSQQQQQQQYASSMAPTVPPYHHYSPHGLNNYDYMPQQQQQQQQYVPAASYYPTPENFQTYRTEQQPPVYFDARIPQPVDGGLDPVTFSIGSMMSIGTVSKLEDAGLSLGSAMSCTPIPVVNTNDKAGEKTSGAMRPPDGGLEEVGTSFGSLSLVEGERERIIADADRDLATSNVYHNNMRSSHHQHHSDAYDAAIPTTLLHQQKSRGSLLESNDLDDEGDETTSAEARSQKGAHQWNMLQATLAMQDESIRNAVSVPPMFVMNSGLNYQRQPQIQQHPPNRSSSYRHHNFPLDATTLDRDYSQMSAISVGDDFEPQPPRSRAPATTTSRHDTNIYNNEMENDPNWDIYESTIRQDDIMPPTLNKSYTNRY